MRSTFARHSSKIESRKMLDQHLEEEEESYVSLYQNDLVFLNLKDILIAICEN